MPDTSWVDRREYPFTDHYLDLPMGRMHYVDEGRGHPVVMVHGTPEWSFGYRCLIKGLSSRYRCIACDHIGFGLSDKPGDWSYLPSAHAQNLAALIDALELKDITLVVHDFGGPIGLSYAVEHPENVRDLVLMNTWMWSLSSDPHFTGTKMFHGAVGKFLYERLAFSPRVMLPLAMGDRSKLTRPIHRQYLAPWRTPQERHGTWVFAREVVGSGEWYDSLWQRRAALAGKPVLILWGMKDFAFRPVELEKLKGIFDRPQVIPFGNTGHFLTEELGDALVPLVGDFLDSGQLPAGRTETRSAFAQ